jgi:hypothetical protein
MPWKKNGYWHDTMIILTTDHGIAFPHMKCNLYDTGIGITLALRIPGQEMPPLCDALVSHVDIFPTICDVLQKEPPAWLQGQSLLPLFCGTESIRSEVFAEVTYHAAYEPMRCIRTMRHKLIVHYDTDFKNLFCPISTTDRANVFCWSAESATLCAAESNYMISTWIRPSATTWPASPITKRSRSSCRNGWNGFSGRPVIRCAKAQWQNPKEPESTRDPASILRTNFYEK